MFTRFFIYKFISLIEMKIQQTKGFADIPLHLAKEISQQANHAFHTGAMQKAVTPTTAELLKYWFEASYCDIRNINFHEGLRTHQQRWKSNLLRLFVSGKIPEIRIICKEYRQQG